MGEPIPADGADTKEIIAKLVEAGIEHDDLAADLHCEATELFFKDWNEMLDSIWSKSAVSNAAT